MNKTHSLGIAGRLTLVAIGLTTALIGSAIFAHSNLSDISQASQRTGHHRIPQLAEMADIELNVTRSSLQIRHAILARNTDERDASLNDIQKKRQAIDQLLDDYEGLLFTPEGREKFAPIRPSIAKFWTTAEANLALIKAGQKEEAFAYLVDHTIPARNALLTHLSNTVEFQRENALKDVTTIERNVNQTRTVLLTLFASIAIALWGFSWWVNRTLKARINTSREVAERVRDGDLSQRISQTGNDEFSPLLQALADMQASLTGVVSKVRDNANAVASSSSQIAQGSNELSERTEKQASSLQQTASTMAQLGTTVRHNTDNAAQATAMANEASSVAQQGGNAVKDVVETMQGIHEASRKISDIIAVIDGIAFQTNILALNAAVEAARAGEQGRGFAVVAGEVRSLAQRSAEAAREIKSLITVSAEKVERGSQLVDHAGHTMTQIVSAIERVNAIVSEISQASVQQQAGVQQVGQSVSEMDHSTQQNAALVEQSAAAAESLQQQSRELVQSVAVFKL